MSVQIYPGYNINVPISTVGSPLNGGGGNSEKVDYSIHGHSMGSGAGFYMICNGPYDMTTHGANVVSYGGLQNGWTHSATSTNFASSPTRGECLIAASLTNAVIGTTYSIYGVFGDTFGNLYDGYGTLDIIGPATCTYVLSQTVFSVVQGGGTVTVGVTVEPGCTYLPSSNDSWITVSSALGNGGDFSSTAPRTAGGAGGPGHQSFIVAANTGRPRTGTVVLGGQTITINQAGRDYRRNQMLRY